MYAAAEAEEESAQPPSNPNETTASPARAQMPADIAADVTSPEPLEEKVMTVGEELAFEGRLAELKENSKVLAKVCLQFHLQCGSVLRMVECSRTHACGILSTTHTNVCASNLTILQEKTLKKKSSNAVFAPPPGTTTSEPYKNPPSIMDTMTNTTPSEEKVDVFGGNQAVALGASVVLAIALLFGTIYTGGGDDESGRKQKVRLFCFLSCHTLIGSSSTSTAMPYICPERENCLLWWCT